MQFILMIFTFFVSINLATAQDFSDNTSSSLTSQAWNALNSGDHAMVIAYTDKCIELYLTQAIEMQSILSSLPQGNQEDVAKYWALNDVGTCLFIKGKSLLNHGDKVSAQTAFQMLVKQLSYAQCWDSNGWFWSPAEAAKKELERLQVKTKI